MFWSCARNFHSRRLSLIASVIVMTIGKFQERHLAPLSQYLALTSPHLPHIGSHSFSGSHRNCSVHTSKMTVLQETSNNQPGKYRGTHASQQEVLKAKPARASNIVYLHNFLQMVHAGRKKSWPRHGSNGC